LFDQIRELLSIPDHELSVATKIGARVCLFRRTRPNG
jgi:hypothetical protein